MQKEKQNPLREALVQFEENGFDVNYSQLTIYGENNRCLRNTDIALFGEIDEDADAFIMNCTGHISCPFTDEAKKFLEHMEARLEPTDDAKFMWLTPSIFSLILIKDNLSAYNNFPEHSLKIALRKNLHDCHQFAFSCAYTLNLFGRMKLRYGNRKLPRSMDLEKLICFCLADLAEKRTYM